MDDVVEKCRFIGLGKNRRGTGTMPGIEAVNASHMAKRITGRNDHKGRDPYTGSKNTSFLFRN